MPSRTLVADHLLFDSRLALFHQSARWLAIADLHYGYELSQRASGALFPAWGMEKIEQRLMSLLTDYQPQTVLFLGDLVHTAAAAQAFSRWLLILRAAVPNLVLLRGNHDRHLRDIAMYDQWRIDLALFHHGDRIIESQPEDVLFSGHLHPAHSLSDGAGLQQKLPTLCRTARGWILPAFSPWAAGGRPQDVEILERWVSNHDKIWKLR
ncbi:MAG TPA: metallophosphoesterase [Chthoniobacterales bacterium]|jgi:metallophosphoesterase superfamily enzyme